MGQGKYLGIIQGINFGMRDCPKPCVWFGVKTFLHGGSLQVFLGEQALEFVKKAGCRSINDLNGKPCIMRPEGNNMVFVELAK